jgi:Flp pilus assembly protein TadG
MPARTEKKQHKPQHPRGQSLIEFALLLPLLLVLIVSAIEFGRLFHTKIVITNAAREGAYFYATNLYNIKETADLEQAARVAAIAEADNSGIPVILVEFDRDDSGENSSIKVTVSTEVENLIIFGFAGNLLSVTATRGSWNVISTVEMMVQP